MQLLLTLVVEGMKDGKYHHLSFTLSPISILFHMHFDCSDYVILSLINLLCCSQNVFRFESLCSFLVRNTFELQLKRIQLK